MSDLTRFEQLSLEAIQYVLSRAQEDPDLRYHLCPLTESFGRLCAAEAALTGRREATVRHDRSQTTTPKHREQRSKEEILEDRLGDLQRKLQRLARGIESVEDLDPDELEAETEDEELIAAQERVSELERTVTQLRRELQEALGQQRLGLGVAP